MSDKSIELICLTITMIAGLLFSGYVMYVLTKD